MAATDLRLRFGSTRTGPTTVNCTVGGGGASKGSGKRQNGIFGNGLGLSDLVEQLTTSQAEGNVGEHLRRGRMFLQPRIGAMTRGFGGADKLTGVGRAPTTCTSCVGGRSADERGTV